MKAFILKSIYPLFLLFILSYIKGVSQDRIILKDSTVIESKISEVSKTLIKYRKASDTTDLFLETDQLRSLKIGDTTYVIYPASLANKRSMIATADFRKSLLNQGYAYLLHSVTILQDANFAKGKIEILPTSRTKLLPLIDILKSNKSVKYVLAVHTDTVGKTITNLTLSKKRATYLRNFFIANGVKPENISAEGKGESEPLYFSQATLAFNRRVEIRVTAVEKTKVLYAEKYVRPQTEVSNQSISKNNSTQPASENTKSSVTTSPKKQPESYFDVTVFANANYILGSDEWKNPSDGYGHLAGWGCSVLGEYYLMDKIAVGLKIGYNRWKTTLNFKETIDGIVYKQHINEANQIPIAGTFRFKLGKRLYLIPEGGISFITITTNEIGISTILKKIQIGYGLSAGYTSAINKWLAYEVSGFYCNFSLKELSPMQYAGIRIALKTSIK